MGNPFWRALCIVYITLAFAAALAVSLLWSFHTALAAASGDSSLVKPVGPWRITDSGAVQRQFRCILHAGFDNGDRLFVMGEPGKIRALMVVPGPGPHPAETGAAMIRLAPHFRSMTRFEAVSGRALKAVLPRSWQLQNAFLRTRVMIIESESGQSAGSAGAESIGYDLAGLAGVIRDEENNCFGWRPEGLPVEDQKREAARGHDPQTNSGRAVFAPQASSQEKEITFEQKELDGSAEFQHEEVHAPVMHDRKPDSRSVAMASIPEKITPLILKPHESVSPDWGAFAGPGEGDLEPGDLFAIIPPDLPQSRVALASAEERSRGSRGMNIIAPAAGSGSPFWRAEQGEKLDTVLARWSERAGTTLVWQGNGAHRLVQPFSHKGSFAEAARALLSRENEFAAVIAAARAAAVEPASGQRPAPAKQEAGLQKRWRAIKGADLKTVFEVWSEDAGVELRWIARDGYAVLSSYDAYGSFEKAAGDLLREFEKFPERPRGHFFVNSEGEGKVLTIYSEKL